MTKKTQNAIDKKLEQMTDNNHYQWYQKFHNAGKTNRTEVAQYYIVQKPNLKEVFEEICDGRTLHIDDSDYRKAKEFLLSLRGTDCNDKIIFKETYIQRNLFNNSDIYADKLGHIFGYEVTFIRKNRCAPVDLISCKLEDGKLCFNLIELKACEAATINSPAGDLLLRAIFEGVTYRAYFKNILAKNQELAKAIYKTLKGDGRTPIGIREILADEEKALSAIQEADIKVIVLAPDYIINEIENKYMNGFVNDDIHLFTLKAKSEVDDKTTVGSRGEFFIIDEKKVTDKN